MQPQRWSVNGLCVETGFDRRTLSMHLATVEPAGQGTHGPLYYLRDVLQKLRADGRLYFPADTDQWNEPTCHFIKKLNRALRRGLAEQLAEATTPEKASRLVREFFADLAYRAFFRLPTDPKPPDWTQADDRRFEKAYRLLMNADAIGEDIVAVLEGGKPTEAG